MPTLLQHPPRVAPRPAAGPPAPSRPAAAPPRRRVLAAFVAASLVLRVWEFGAPRAFWLDERYIAVAVDRDDVRALAGLLPIGPSAPAPWPWLEQVLTSAGFADRVLLAPALVASCAAVLCTVLAGRRLFHRPAGPVRAGLVTAGPATGRPATGRPATGRPAGLVTAGLVGGVPVVVSAATGRTPYGIDLALTALLLWLALRAVQDGRCTAFWWTAAATLWCSQTTVLLIVTMGPVLLWHALRRGVPLARLALAVGVVGVSAAVLYVVHVRPNLGGPWTRWWCSHVLPIAAPRPLTGPGLLAWAAGDIDPALPVACALLVPLVAGGWLLCRRDRLTGALVLGPVALAGLLGLLHLGPSRPTLWLAPLLLVPLGAVVDEATRARPASRPTPRPASQPVPRPLPQPVPQPVLQPVLQPVSPAAAWPTSPAATRACRRRTVPAARSRPGETHGLPMT